MTHDAIKLVLNIFHSGDLIASRRITADEHDNRYAVVGYTEHIGHFSCIVDIGRVHAYQYVGRNHDELHDDNGRFSGRKCNAILADIKAKNQTA